MSKRIDKITPEQAARFNEWSEKWIEIGLSTEPADFERAIKAALKGYKLANLKKPMVVLRMSSPYAATVGGALAWILLKEYFGKQVEQQVRQQVGQQVWQQVWQQVEQQVWQQVGQQVRQQVRQRVGQQVWQQVRQQVWQQIEQQIEQQVGQQVRQQVWQQIEQQVGQQVGQQVEQQVEQQIEQRVGQQVRQQVWQQVEQQVEQQKFQAAIDGINNYGINSLWCSWGAYVSFFRDVCGWRNPILKKFEIDEELIKSCGWTWWHQNILAISDRPQKINRDDQGRLHCETGPSILYRDGWALWNWHGISVPQEWITDKTKLMPSVALTWKNIEQRRAACEIVGWEKILHDLNAKTINKDVDPQIGELVEVNLPDNGPQRFLRVQCATGRKFALPVPATMKTALEANAATYGIPPNLFKPEIRT